MTSKLELPKLTDLRPRITVIGVGGAGGNAINNMIASGLDGVEFVVANTDAQALAQSSAEHRIQLGINLTEGLGAGSRPEIGQAAAEEAFDEIRSQISGSHMVFVAAGMGGGTGSGAAGVIAKIAKELGILTVGIVTKPFQFEGVRRMRVAEAGISELARYVDTLIVIPNQNLFRIANARTTFAEAFVLADQVLYSGIACIVDLIVKDGLINLDFADVRTVMSGMGTAMMGTGEATGERRAVLAAEEAIANPLLDDVSLKGARGLLLSIIGGKDMTLFEVDEAASRIRAEVDAEANIIVGASFDEAMGDRLRVSIVASGMARAADKLLPGSAGAGTPHQPTANNHGRTAPPPLPPSHGPAPRSDSLTHQLSQAMELPGMPLPGQAGAASGLPSRNSPVWQAPGDVKILQSLPPLGLPIPAAPRPPAPASQASADTFSPRTPSELPRPAQRMPEVDDFPPVGQREYRARNSNSDVAQQTDQRPRPHQAPASGSHARKPGLFERLTGIGRRESESPQRTTATYPQADTKTGASSTGSGPAGPGQRPQGEPHRLPGKTPQASELPVFFNRDRS
jgi:cell division protein FtsZ